MSDKKNKSHKELKEVVDQETLNIDDILEDIHTEEDELEDNFDDAVDVEVLETLDVKIAEQLVKAELALKEANDRYQRTMAEFDNFRKRTLKEKSAMFESGAKDVLEKLLPVLDNIERAISHIKEDEKNLSITQGVEMIYKQFMASFDEIGVTEIDALHKEFDPNFHHAVSHEDNDAYDDNLVADVFQKGYMYKDSVLRHSMVKVVN